MKAELTRKEFLANGAKLAVGAVAGIGIMNSLGAKTLRPQGALVDWPWPYQQLDTEKVRILGHDNFWSSGSCSYGAFHAIIQALRDAVGDPYTSLPTEMLIYGYGGGVGWGTLCGALNGPAAAISLVCVKARSDVIINELFGWYTQTNLPADTSNTYATEHRFTDTRYDQVLPQNMSGSPLCHASVTEWCKHAHFTATSTERKERCARLTGDVAAYAVKLLNDEFGGTFTPTYVPPSTIAGCQSCHGTSGVNNVAAKMECTQCHGNPHVASSVELIGGAGLTYELTQNYPNPFNPSTSIQFTIPRQENVSLRIYDIHGREVRTLIGGQQYMPGSYRIEWDGRDNFGRRVASGIYFSRVQAGHFSAARKMSLLK